MPFAGDITSIANGTLLLSAAAALLYGILEQQPQRPLRSVVKTAAVALLGVLAWVEDGPLLLAAALFLSAAGDFLLSRDGERAFLAGLSAFLAAHLAYVALFVAGDHGATILIGELWRGAATLVVVAFAVIMLRVLWRGLPSQMRTPVIAYIAAIVAMGVSALTVEGVGVSLGAGLFIVSDALLAIGKFRLADNSPAHDWLQPAVWVLYYAGQLVMTLAIIV